MFALCLLQLSTSHATCCFLFCLFCECVSVWNHWVFVGVKAMHTYTTLSLLYWKYHSCNCPYHSLSITAFSLPLSINCDSNKSLFITPGNSDVRPDPELGSHPIQLEHINEKSCTIQPMSTEDDVPFGFPLTLQTLYLGRNILSCSAVLAGTTNAVCVYLRQGRLL